MALISEFIPLELSELRRQAAVLKADGWRFMQTHAANGIEGIDLYYSFMKDGKAVNYRISDVAKDQPVPSITDLFLAAFVFENEARELFGVNMQDIAIDFHGGLYAPAVSEPMTFMTPEQKAKRDKAMQKVAAERGAGAKPSQPDSEQTKAEPIADGVDGAAPPVDASSKANADGKHVFVMTPERRARLDAKLATMSPDKVAKVEAALAAREAEAASATASTEKEGDAPQKPSEATSDTTNEASQDSKPETRSEGKSANSAKPDERDSALEDAIAVLDPEKAAKVRAAIAGKVAADTGLPAKSVVALADESSADMLADGQLEGLIDKMDDSKAAIIRAALKAKGGK